MRPTPENAARAHRALVAFGAPMADLTVDDLATPGTIFQIGIAPNRVDILTAIEAEGEAIFQEQDRRGHRPTQISPPSRRLQALPSHRATPASY